MLIKHVLCKCSVGEKRHARQWPCICCVSVICQPCGLKSTKRAQKQLPHETVLSVITCADVEASWLPYSSTFPTSQPDNPRPSRKSLRQGREGLPRDPRKTTLKKGIVEAKEGDYRTWNKASQEEGQCCYPSQSKEAKKDWKPSPMALKVQGPTWLLQYAAWPTLKSTTEWRNGGHRMLLKFEHALTLGLTWFWDNFGRSGGPWWLGDCISKRIGNNEPADM